MTIFIGRETKIHIFPTKIDEKIASHLGSSRDRLPGSRLGFLVSVGSARVQGVHSLLHRKIVRKLIRDGPVSVVVSFWTFLAVEIQSGFVLDNAVVVSAKFEGFWFELEAA